jgi:hypothetical protein
VINTWIWNILRALVSVRILLLQQIVRSIRMYVLKLANDFVRCEYNVTLGPRGTSSKLPRPIITTRLDVALVIASSITYP